jgi:hypothetical protein
VLGAPPVAAVVPPVAANVPALDAPPADARAPPFAAAGAVSALEPLLEHAKTEATESARATKPRARMKQLMIVCRGTPRANLALLAAMIYMPAMRRVRGRLAVGVWLLALALSAFVYAPGLHDNDFPLWVWLGRRATLHDLSGITIGQHAPVALLLVGALSALGNALALAKAFNLACIAGATWLVIRLARSLAPSPAPPRFAVVAAAFFMVSAQTLLLAQSEFGDPPVVFFYLLGLERLFARRPFHAGLAFGAASLFRIYAPTFVVGTVVLALVLGVVPWRRAHALALGAGLGGLVQPLFYWFGRGTLTSPIADFVIGEVVLGVDEFDWLHTWNAHPSSEVLRHHRAQLADLVSARLLAFPTHLLPALATAILAALVFRERRRVFLLALVGFYYAAYVCLSWNITFRLLLLPVALLAVMVGAAARGRILRIAGALSVLAALLYTLREVPEDLARVRLERARSEELTAVLRAGGLRSAREAFVVDWNRFLTDDPVLEPFYNFGFWNSLAPAFEAERPTPFAHTGSASDFAQFVAAHGARFVVFQPDVDRFPALLGVFHGTAELPGYERIAMLPFATVYRRRE